MSTAIREKLHHLVDDLPDSELQAAQRFLQYLRDVGSDPFLRAVANAPEDDEPETEEEHAAIAEAREALERGEVISDEELRRELGL